MMQCSKCAHEIDVSYFPLSLIHCPYCGERISADEPERYLPFCSACGERLLTEVSFCPRCGKSTAPEPKPAHLLNEPAPLFAEVQMAKPALDTLVVVPPADGLSSPPCYRQPKELPRPHEALWTKIKKFYSLLARLVKEKLSNEGKLEKLYQTWTAEAGLPPEEIPSSNELKTLSRTAQGGPTPPPLRLQNVVLIGLAIVIVFVAMGVLIWATVH
jgi:hypothetical protein